MLVTIARNYEIKRARHTIVVKLQLAMGEFVVEPLAVPKGIIGDPPPPAAEIPQSPPLPAARNP